MKSRVILILTLIFQFIFILSCSKQEHSYWNLSSNDALVEKLSLDDNFQVSNSTLYSLNLASLTNLLEDTKELLLFEDSSQGVNIILPLPDSSYQMFEVWEVSIMQEGLKEKFPNTKTYFGKGVDDPSLTTRFEWTSEGLSGAISSLESTSYFNQYEDNREDIYVSYLKDLKGSEASFREENLKPPSVEPERIPLDDIPQFEGKVKKKILRIAIAGTPDYTSYFGSKERAFNNVIRAVQRVNLIFERDLGVSFKLVNRSDELLFDNREFYSSTNLDKLLNENQAILDSIIQSPNYDVGHLFSIRGGGMAEIASAGISSIKAMGVTGIYPPESEKFYVDYFAHELGHQLGANHTFYGQCSDCKDCRKHGVKNRAYEPGCGTTIMGYAGVCKNLISCKEDNVQNRSDDYFHAINIYEITSHLERTFSSNKNRFVSSPNNYPVLKIPNNLFHIPHSTPFALEAIGQDEDSLDNLTYTWEQVDLRNVLVRSISPSKSGTRYIPNINALLNNHKPPWENLIEKRNGELNFLATIRDNNPIIGGINFDKVKLKVYEHIGPFKVISPSKKDNQFNANDRVLIKWEAARTNLHPVNCEIIEVFLSLDNGESFQLLGEELNERENTFVTLPNTASPNAVIMVKAKNNIFFDVSDTFEISQPNNLEQIFKLFD